MRPTIATNSDQLDDGDEDSVGDAVRQLSFWRIRVQTRTKTAPKRVRTAVSGGDQGELTATSSRRVRSVPRWTSLDRDGAGFPTDATTVYRRKPFAARLRTATAWERV
jgi:hypothetical protein